MSTQPQFETPHETIKRLWREGKNTNEIAQHISWSLGSEFSEAQVCRVLHGIRDDRAKGGAE